MAGKFPQDRTSQISLLWPPKEEIEKDHALDLERGGQNECSEGLEVKPSLGEKVKASSAWG